MTTLLALHVTENAIVRISVEDGSSEYLTRSSGAAPDGIVVVGDRAYWTTMGAPIENPDIPGEAGDDFTVRNGGVHTIKLDGTDLRDVLPTGSITTGKQIATDGRRLYWSDREGYKVSSCNLDGSDLKDHVVNTGRDIAEQCVGVTVDAAAGHLYWTQKGPTDGGKGRILRTSLADPADPAARTDIETLWSGLPEPIDIEIADGYLYWTDRGAPPNGNTLNRAPLPAPGATGAAPEILARDFREAIGLAVDSSAGLAYVSDLGGAIRAVPLPGSTAADRVVATYNGPVTGIVLETR
ncbi:hypothetical protein ACXYTP_06055 [Tsukamurella ocularis]|uniref:hypothetical protein n=1 Tax=Tsukamurella ocularis TaxID=1970234 RepID=UPI0039EE9F9C